MMMTKTEISRKVKSTLEKQIVQAYELYDLEPDIIAEELRIEEETVKCALLKHSDKYRSEIDEETGDHPDITPHEFRRICKAYKDIALDEETDVNTRERALKFLFNEYKGRNNTGLNKGTTLNLTQINNIIADVKDEAKRLLSAPGPILENDN